MTKANLLSSIRIRIPSVMRILKLVLICVCFKALAQNEKIYTLDQCIAHALKNNENLKTAGLNVELQDNRIAKTQAKWLKETLSIRRGSSTASILTMRI